MHTRAASWLVAAFSVWLIGCEDNGTVRRTLPPEPLKPLPLEYADAAPERLPAPPDPVREARTLRIGKVMKVGQVEVELQRVRIGKLKLKTKARVFDSEPLILIDLKVTNTSQTQRFAPIAALRIGRDDQGFPLDAFLLKSGTSVFEPSYTTLAPGQSGLSRVEFPPTRPDASHYEVELSLTVSDNEYDVEQFYLTISAAELEAAPE